jgi:hypothetical protein
VYEALRDEAAEQAARDAMLEVELHDIVVESLGRLENDGADRSVAPPLPWLLAALARWPQQVEGVGPTRVSARVAIERGEAETSWGRGGVSERAVTVACRRAVRDNARAAGAFGCERLRTENLERCRNGAAEAPRVERQVALRAVE